MVEQRIVGMEKKGERKEWQCYLYIVVKIRGIKIKVKKDGKLGKKEYFCTSKKNAGS